MAEEVILKISADIDDVKRKIDALDKAIEDVNTTTKETNESVKDMSSSLDKATGGMVSGFKKGVQGIKAAVAGMRTLKGAIIATGVGALVVAFTSLVAYFNKTEEGAQRLRVITAVLGGVMDKLGDGLVTIGKTLFDAFNNPEKAIQELGKSIKYYFTEFIPNAIKKVLGGFGLLGTALGKLLKGDLEGAAQAATDGVKKLADGITDLNPATAIIKSIVVEVVELGVEALESAGRIGKLEQAMNRVIMAERALLVERSKAAQKIAQLRLEAQDTELPLDERIKKLKEANDLENEITAKQIALENERLRIMKARAAESSSDETVIQAIAEQEAKVIDLQTASFMRQKEIVSQISGMRKQAADEELARIKEIAEARKAAADAEKAISDQILSDMDKIEQATLSAQDREWQAAYDHYQELILLAEKYGQDVSALRTAQAAATAEVDAKYAQQAADKVLAIEEAKQNAAYTLASTALGNVGLLVEQNAEASKGIAVAQTIWNTATGIMGALTSPGGWLVGLGAANWLNAAAVAATGVTQLALIGRTTRQSSGGTPSTPSAGATSGANILNNQPAFQMRELFGQQNQVQRAYVVGNDITTQQQLDRRLRLSATFG